MTTDPKETPPPTSKVTQAAGGTWPILPGESNALYKKGLEATLKELGATTEWADAGSVDTHLSE